MTQRNRYLLRTAVIAALGTTASAQVELNALVWCDHTDPALIEPFEAAHNAKVNLREYEGNGAALALLGQSRPGDWDVLVIDGIGVLRAVETGILAPLPADQLPTADFLPEVVMAENNILETVAYAVMEKFACKTVSYTANKVEVEDMPDMATVWSDKYKGRLSI